MITQDVVNAFQTIATNRELPEHRRNRALEMGDGMALFCSGLAGHFFNRPGQSWPKPMSPSSKWACWPGKGYEDQLTVAYLSMMSHINDLVERHQHDDRPTLVVTDEGHIITTNFAGALRGQDHQMWRKLGAWFWMPPRIWKTFRMPAAKCSI